MVNGLGRPLVPPTLDGRLTLPHGGGMTATFLRIAICLEITS